MSAIADKLRGAVLLDPKAEAVVYVSHGDSCHAVLTLDARALAEIADALDVAPRKRVSP